MQDYFALTVGINQYRDPSANLNGCVNDATDWATLLSAQGYRTTTLLDSQATRSQVLTELESLVDAMGYRDRLVFQYSGHGSWVPDRSGDEDDGRDEVLVMHDFTHITDDDLDQIFRNKPYGSRITVISDSCHSGSVNRFVEMDETEEPRQPRFLSPAWLDLAPEQENLLYFAWNSAPRTFTGTNRSVLFSGCADNEYSYDAWFGSNLRPNGAFTRAAIDAYRPGMSNRQWHAAILATPLPSDDYPQTPQLGVASYYQSRQTALA